MRFIENLSFALKKRVQKIFFKGCGLGQVLEWHIELPHLAKKRRINKMSRFSDKNILASIVKIR